MFAYEQGTHVRCYPGQEPLEGAFRTVVLAFQAFSSDRTVLVKCEDRVLDGPASGEKDSNGRNQLDCIRCKGVRRAAWLQSKARHMHGRLAHRKLASWWFYGVGCFLTSEEPLQSFL